MNDKPITDIVFDVGRVLIDFSYDAFFDGLRAAGAVIHSVDDFVQQTQLHAYERGQIDDQQFLDRLNGLLHQPLDRAQLIAQWLGLFTPNDDMLQLAQQLKTRYGVYLLSNTSALHWRHVVPHYGLDRLCHGMLTSYEIGAMKPEAAIFQATAKRFNLQAKTTVFIDDIADNAEGARRCGWHAIHHKNSCDTRRQLRALGLILD